MELLKKYTEEVAKELVVDELNIKQVQLRLPARRHFWIGRLIDAKVKLSSLQKQEKALRATLTKKLKEESPVAFTTQHLDGMINNHPEFTGLAAQIEEYKYIIEYLEKVEKVMTNMGYDIKNIIELQKLEQL